MENNQNKNSMQEDFNDNEERDLDDLVHQQTILGKNEDPDDLVHLKVVHGKNEDPDDVVHQTPDIEDEDMMKEDKHKEGE